MWFGLFLVIIPFLPYLKEYLGFLSEEKEFATKEVVIISIGFVLAVGSKFWDKIVLVLIERFRKKNKKEDA